MATTTDDNIKLGAEPYLRPHEHIVATLIASVRGHQQAGAGGAAGMFGGKRQAHARRAADAAGISLASPMAFVLTSGRLLTFETGGRGRPRRLLNEFALSEVGAMEVRRLGFGASVTIVVAGTPVKLESRVAAARTFAGELARTKS